MPLPFAIPAIPGAWKLGLKIAVVAIAFAIGLGSGCSLQAKKDAVTYGALITKKNTALATAGQRLAFYASQLQGLSNTLTEISRIATSEKAAGEAREAAALAQAEGAKADKLKSDARRRRVERDLAEAKKDPDCKRLLETLSCASFR